MEIIYTLLSCDNIFFVHVLYVFSLVLFYLLMIVQCLDFKSIKLLLLLLLSFGPKFDWILLHIQNFTRRRMLNVK
jgi:hypothetical protein